MGGVSSPQLDAATMDGVLLKRGKIVKSWKCRYFILNPEKKELCYYDSKKKEKCHGVITLTDEDSVEQGDPQIVPGLKPNENGYFFNLITSKRTYYLMAKSNNERAEWMVRIKNALPITTV
jgi:myotubularin-related protein 5/13